MSWFGRVLFGRRQAKGRDERPRASLAGAKEGYIGVPVDKEFYEKIVNACNAIGTRKTKLGRAALALAMPVFLEHPELVDVFDAAARGFEVTFRVRKR